MAKLAIFVSNIDGVVKRNDSLPYPVGEFVRADETGAGFSIEDGDQELLRLGAYAFGGINLIIPFIYDNRGLGVGFPFYKLA